MSNKLSHYEPGQMVWGLDGTSYRILSKITGPGGAVVKLASAEGKPLPIPANFIPVTRRFLRFAGMMRWHLAFNKNFDSYINSICENQGLPTPVGPDGQPFRWADWFQDTICPKLHAPKYMNSVDAQVLKDEIIFDMITTALITRMEKYGGLKGAFKNKMRNFTEDTRSLKLAKRLNVFITWTLKYRVGEMNKNIVRRFHKEDVSLYQPGTGEENDGEGEEYNILDTEEHAVNTKEFESVEAKQDIVKFRQGFEIWLFEKLTTKAAQAFLTLFDLYWEWISESGEDEKTESGYSNWSPGRNDLKPEWQSRTNLSDSSLYEYIGRLAALIQEYIRLHRKELGPNNTFVHLIDQIQGERQRLKKKKKRKKKPKAMPAHAALAALNLAADQGMEPLTGGSPAMSLEQLHKKMDKTAHLVRGEDLTPEMRQQVLDAPLAANRWTTENPHRAEHFECDLCDVQNPYTDVASAEGHPHPTVPLQTDDEWLREHAFHFTNDGRLFPDSPKRSIVPAYLAEAAPQPELVMAASADPPAPLENDNITGPKEDSVMNNDLADAVENILQARDDQMLTAADWDILQEALQNAPQSNLASKVHELLNGGQEDEENWIHLTEALALWIAINAKRLKPHEKEATEPLQQLRPDITPGDTGRLPHGRTQGSVKERVPEFSQGDKINLRGMGVKQGVAPLVTPIGQPTADPATIPVPANPNNGPLTPQQMQEQNIEKAQGKAPSGVPGVQVQQNPTNTDPNIAVLPSGVGGNNGQPQSRRTILPEVPMPNLHASWTKRRQSRLTKKH